MGYIFLISWVDDVRYFETQDMVAWYRKEAPGCMPITDEGESQEFVSLEIKQDLVKGTLEETESLEKLSALSARLLCRNRSRAAAGSYGRGLLGAAALLDLLAEVLVTARIPVLRLARGAAVARVAARAPLRVVRDGLGAAGAGR